MLIGELGSRGVYAALRGSQIQEGSFLGWMELVMVSLCADQAEGMMFQAEVFCLTA